MVFEFLSHLSGDEVLSIAGDVGHAFLSHLSGDEERQTISPPFAGFLSHLTPAVNPVYINLGDFDYAA